MKHPISIGLLAVPALVLLALSGHSVQAQFGGGYELTWTTVDTGGGTVTSGAYSLDSTIGQAEAGAAASGGAYTLSGGVWGGSGGVTPLPGGKRVYLPMLLR